MPELLTGLPAWPCRGMRRSIRTSIRAGLILLIAGFGSLAAAASELPWLNATAYLLEDPDGRLDLPAVLDRPGSYWRAVSERPIPLAFARSTWWLRIELRNAGTTPRSLILDAARPTQGLLDFYVVRAGQVLESHLSGNLRPFSARPLAYRGFALPLDLPAGEFRHVYLRLGSPAVPVMTLPLRIEEPAAFAEARLGDNLLLGTCLGVLLGLALFHFLQFLLTRDRLSLNFAGVAGLLALQGAGVTGYGPEYLWPDAPAVNRLFEALLPALILASGTRLALLYLECRDKNPAVHRLLQLFVALSVLAAAGAMAAALGFDPARPAAAGLTRILAIVVPVALGLAGLPARHRGHPPIRFFASAWGAAALAILLGEGQAAGAIAAGPWLLQHGPLVTTVLATLLLALALADRANWRRIDDLAAKHSLLEWQSAQTGKLEARLRDRTAELGEAQRRLENLARADVLTQLPNLRAFQEVFPREFARARRERQLLALALLDLDRFKHYNDHHGYAAGDNALQQVSIVLTSHLRRPSDYAFRLGDDEFGILLALTESEEKAMALLERVREAIRALGISHVGNEEGVVTPSIGLAFNRGMPNPLPEALYRNADEALFRAKAAGRNRMEAVSLDDP